MEQPRPLSFFLCLRRKTRSARRKETRRFSREELRISKTSLSSVWPAFLGCEVSSNKRSIQKLGSLGVIVDGEDGRESVERYLENGECASIPPLREGGAARWKDCQWDCAFGANGKGGGGSTAGSRRCMRPLGPSAKFLIRPSVRSRACRDGRPQYSPRRGPCRLSFAMHPPSIHGRATPLSEGGGPVALLAPCNHDLVLEFHGAFLRAAAGHGRGESILKPRPTNWATSRPVSSATSTSTTQEVRPSLR